MVWDPRKYKVTGGNAPSNIDPSKQDAASIVTSDGEEIGMEKTNKDGTKTDAISAALEAGRKPSRIQFNPAFESRIEGAKERQAQRAEARKQIVDFKRKEKLETQGKRLDKKVLRRTGEERTNKMSAKQASDEDRFNKIAQQLPKPIDLTESVKDTRLLMDPIDKTKKYGSISHSAGNRSKGTSALSRQERKQELKTRVPGFDGKDTFISEKKAAKDYISNMSFDINKYKQ